MTAPRFADPRYRRDCARAALRLLRDRQAALPRFVEQGQIEQADADRAIRLAECLVAQWRWIVDPARPGLPSFDDRTGFFGAFCFELAEDLATAARRQRARAERPGAAEDASALADFYEALAHLQRVRVGAALVVGEVDVERSMASARLAEAA
ncbi:hypothetical protein D9601_06545 [Sphingomonas sp. MA1305]|uniref:hypothetical protein n=1 Tax=Sphingomonas sp. MA1305 TaxID=2479204 RepID=UPI0018DF7C2E|nr:hypothetical protein [Sphingomonas sp. MA1305]MBI0475018.1 hypothetical protein [Sphingomonas sp. MA1305]